MMVVGGVGSVWGPLLGAAALMLTDEALKEAVEYRNIGLGLLLVLFAMLWPKGIAGALDVAKQRLKRRIKPVPSEQHRRS